MAARLNHPPLVVIVGETASGKTELGVFVAEKFNGEVIAADSWTVYKDFTIGTAKPNTQDRMRVPHHLLDIAEPSIGYSAAEYKRHALSVIEEISSRNKLPILAGGTGLYIDSVLYDYSFLPPASPEIRSSLSKLSVDDLMCLIQDAGFDLRGIDIRNKRRLIRLIETGGAHPVKAQELRPNTLVIGVQISREVLHEHISQRVDGMFDAGLEREVALLAQRYGWDVEPMKGIGYREFYEYFNGSQTLEETRARIITSSLTLAKKQRTWFKRNKSIHWISKRDDAVELITTFLNK